MMELFDHPRFWSLERNPIGRLSWLLPVACYLLVRIPRKPVQWRIFLFALASVLLEYVSTHDRSHFLFREGTNVGWYHLGAPVLFYLMFRVFAGYLREFGAWTYLRFLPLAFALLAAVNALWVDGFHAFPKLTVGVYSICGILLAAGYFYYLLRTLVVTRLEREPLFWMSAGMLIYYSGNFLLWAAITFIPKDRELFFAVYQINGYVTLIMCLAAVIALCIPARPERTADTLPGNPAS